MLHLHTLSPHSTTTPDRPRAIAIGSFDGVHRGHLALIQQLVRVAHAHDCRATVLMLEPQAREFFHRQQGANPYLAPPRLSPLADKLLILSTLPIDEVAVLHFRTNVAQMSAERFIDELLIHRLNARHLLTGEDFRFGAKASGDSALLSQMAEQKKFTYHPMAKVCDEQGMRYSSTLTRTALANADFAQVRALLGRDYTLSGRIQRGLRLAGAWGVPTANVYFRETLAVHGVFVGSACLHRSAEQRWHNALIHIGNPTINPPPSSALSTSHQLSRRGWLEKMEVHLLGQTLPLFYGERLSVRFIDKIRDSLPLLNESELIARIHADVDAAQFFFRGQPKS